MSLRVSDQEQYVGANGFATIAMLRLLKDYERRLALAESKLTAIAAVTAPAGGGTVDSEARTAINAILSAAS